MKVYLDAWFVVFWIAIAIGVALGLWSTFCKNGKVYTRNNLFDTTARKDLGVIAAILCGFAAWWGSSAILLDFFAMSVWMPVILATALIIAALTITGFALYIALLGGLYFGYCVKTAIVETQLRQWDARREAEEEAFAASVLEAAAESEVLMQTIAEIDQFAAEDSDAQ